MDAIGWAEKCMLRYSPASILGGVWEESPYHNLVTGDVFTVDVDHYQNVVEGLLRTLPNKTAGGDSQLKFATGEAQVNASQKVYAMQCTPDLPTTDCLGCLYWAMYYALRPDKGQTGARILVPSCTVRGYMAPEYLHEGTFTVKSDVYSFGILVLEIVAGRKNIIHTPNPETLINWARRSWRNGTPLEIVDQTIASSGVSSEMERCILIALLCVQENPESRPEMSFVIHLLTEESRPALVLNIEPPLAAAAAASLSESQDYQHDLYPR